MQKKKHVAVPVLVFAFFLGLTLYSCPASAASRLLKQGMRGDSVAKLQQDLKVLGFFNATATGYFGGITKTAVRNLQRKYGLNVDGIAGKNTLSLIDRLLQGASVQSSRGAAKDRNGYLVPWFGGAENIFARGTTATVYDIGSGLSFQVKRTYGTNHADCEPLTVKDTKTLKSIYGGTWSWDRRAVIVTVDGRKIAASMAGMPHAGVDSLPANKTVKARSGGYGKGVNLDTVKGNGMDGHFDIHFLGSKTHGSNRVDEAHQAMVKKAAAWAEENL
ncbi:MAG: peptidoglycan-binding domain-containing protein [Clostridiales bacterium]|jgi:hypothetical protein|nr:peptidoglycan-binding protein [Eubacteriales bacterium]MDH7567593.1 peptidoglycan-binding domain-containing protein [Clostridiales bacterium]